MAHGRRNAKREAALTSAEQAHERAAAEREAAAVQASAERQLLRRWGTPRGALNHLSAVSRQLERLHREEAKLLHERDDLISLLRSNGQSWTALSARTKLSRQALMKRQTSASTSNARHQSS